MSFRKAAPWFVVVGVVVGVSVGTAKYKSIQTEQVQAEKVEIQPPAKVMPQSPKPRKWYEGGTLHNASALDWQEAGYANKLATCADFVSGLWQKKLLKPSIQNQIQSVDDLRPFAQELMENIDAAIKKRDDPQENTVIYANQTVSGIASMLIVLLEWGK